MSSSLPIHSANLIGPAPTVIHDTKFTITAPRGTDTWRKPPSTNAFTSPMVYHKVQLSALRRARLTVSATWRTMYDQGGLVLVLPSTPESEANDKPGETSRRWIKSGIEILEGKPWVSCVAAGSWADWSLTPVPAGAGSGGSDGRVKVTIEFERPAPKNGEPSPAMWVYVVHDDGSRQPVREITWAFAEGDGEAWIGAAAAKPTADDDDPQRSLEVTIEGFSVTTTDSV